MSREVARLAGTNRLPPLIVYDVAIPPHQPPSPLSLHHPSASPSLPLPSSRTPSVYGEFMIYPGQSRGQGHREQGSILLLLMCQTPHLLYSSSACHDMPGLTNSPGVATFRPPHGCCSFLLFFSKLLDVTEPHL